MGLEVYPIISVLEVYPIVPMEQKPGLGGVIYHTRGAETWGLRCTYYTHEQKHEARDVSY